MTYNSTLHLRSQCKAILILPLLTLLFWGCTTAKPQPRLDSIVIEVTGDDFNWHFHYPGLDGVFGTPDDRYSVQNLFVPDNSIIRLKLRSNDYVYSFSLPELGLKEIAVPGLSFELQFTTENEQTLRLLGDQFCGFAHESLIGKVYVRNQDSGYYEW